MNRCQSLTGSIVVCYSAVEVLGAGSLDEPCQAQTVAEAQQRPLGSLLRGNSTLLTANRRLEGGSARGERLDGFVYEGGRKTWGQLVVSGVEHRNWVFRTLGVVRNCSIVWFKRLVRR